MRGLTPGDSAIETISIAWAKVQADSTAAAKLVVFKRARDMQKRVNGFTLIELMIVIAIIGILASIAAPSYRDYVRKANMTEITQLANGVKTGLVEFYTLNGRWPTQAEGVSVLGLGAAASYETDVVQSMFITDNIANYGRVIVDVKAGLFGNAGRVRLALTDTGSMVTSTFCEDSFPTDAQFQPYLPDGEC
ncbi:MAG: pilin [Pseudomonadota bacterium]